VTGESLAKALRDNAEGFPALLQLAKIALPAEGDKMRPVLQSVRKIVLLLVGADWNESTSKFSEGRSFFHELIGDVSDVCLGIEKIYVSELDNGSSISVYLEIAKLLKVKPPLPLAYNIFGLKPDSLSKKSAFHVSAMFRNGFLCCLTEDKKVKTALMMLLRLLLSILCMEKKLSQFAAVSVHFQEMCARKSDGDWNRLNNKAIAKVFFENLLTNSRRIAFTVDTTDGTTPDIVRERFADLIKIATTP
jgi:hypothetical protein